MRKKTRKNHGQKVENPNGPMLALGMPDSTSTALKKIFVRISAEYDHTTALLPPLTSISVSPSTLFFALYCHIPPSRMPDDSKRRAVEYLLWVVRFQDDPRTELAKKKW